MLNLHLRARWSKQKKLGIREAGAHAGIYLSLLFGLISLSALIAPLTGRAGEFFVRGRPSADADAFRVFLANHPEVTKWMMENSPNIAMKPFYVIERDGKRWKPRQTLQVCFFSRDHETNRKVIAIARKWTEFANLRFDAGDDRDTRHCTQNMTDIRIAYDWPGGNWSEVGRKALEVSAPRPTMNLRSFDVNPPKEPYFTWIVLHEFGHVLGLEHEFRNPSGTCTDDFDWDYLEQLKGKVEVARMRAFPSTNKYKFSDYDDSSVMRYYFPKEFFRRKSESRCFGPEVEGLSKLDKMVADELYPGLR